MNGSVEDVFAIQEQVSHRIVDALRVVLTPREEQHLKARPIVDLQAYECYLQARQLMWTFTVSALDHARNLIESAQARIGENVRLIGTLGGIHINYLETGEVDAATHLARAQACVDRLAVLDPDSFSLHALRGWLQWRRGEIREAIGSLTRARELDPNNPEVGIVLTYAYILAGQDARARDTADAYVIVDPLTPLFQCMPGFCEVVAGRPAKAVPYYRKFRGLDPGNPIAHLFLIWAQCQAGELSDARAGAEQVALQFSGTPLGALGTAYAAALRGDRATGRSVLTAEVVGLSRYSESMGTVLANVLTLLGDHDAAIDVLENSVRLGVAHYPYLAREATVYAPLRAHPRFQRLLGVVRERWERGGAAAEDHARDPFASTTDAEVKPKPTIAVLPLTNLSASADDEYFADGMTEDIIAQLSQIASLKVISRTSVMRYKKTDLPMGDIAKALGASHVVEGTVRRAGSRLRIVAQLIEAATDAHLWAKTFDRELTDVFAAQAEVAEQVVGALRATLVPAERARIARKPTKDQEAYNLFLLARHHANLVTADGLARATELYQRAVERDPAFARAWAARAQIQLFHIAGYYGVAPRVASANATEWASRALELDPDVAEAHSALGVVAGMIGLDFAEDGRRQARALELSPNLASVHLQYANHLAMTGRDAEALDHAAQALELDPASEYVHIHANWLRYCTRHLDDALAGVEAAETQFGRKVIPLTRGEILIALGRAAETIESFRELYERIPISWNLGHLAWALAAAARGSEARQALARIHEYEQREYVWPVTTALTYAHLGEMDAAFRYLRQCVDDRAAWIQLPYAPTFDVFRDDARFDTLTHQIGAIAPPRWRWPVPK